MRSSGPEWSQADQPRADALAPSPDRRTAPNAPTTPKCQMAGANPSQGWQAGMELVTAGPSTAFAAALNDKLDRIAQRFDRLERHQDATERWKSGSSQFQ